MTTRAPCFSNAAAVGETDAAGRAGNGDRRASDGSPRRETLGRGLANGLTDRPRPDISVTRDEHLGAGCCQRRQAFDALRLIVVGDGRQ